MFELNAFRGSGKVIIHAGGRNNKFFFGKDNIVQKNIIVDYAPICHKVRNCGPNEGIIEIGSKNLFNGELFLNAPVEGRILHIGDKNLFAGGIRFIGHQPHGIYDIKTGQRLNKEENVYLGDQCWIGQSVKFLPKANVKGRSVVGMESIVNKTFEEQNVLIAGIPAEVRKRGITWNINLDASPEDIMESPLAGWT